MKSKIKTIIKILAGLISALIIIFIVGHLIYSLFYPFEYVRRIFVWGDSDVDDYINNLPHSYLSAPPMTFYFDKDLDEGGVASTFEAILNVEDFDTFLEEMDTQALIVIQNDAIKFEKYFNGKQRDSMLTSFSVAKSITSALVGIAIAEGYIDSVHDPITKYLPELVERDSRFEEITIKDLLMMASGLEYQETRFGLFNGDDPITSYYTDQRKAALEFTNVKDPPGEYFLYNKYHPQLLGMIVERATGTSITEYTQQKLWDPLGMEFDGSWSLDSEESDFEKMEAGFNARAIDFAKFGRLYLEGGDWNGDQIIPAEWVVESTQVDHLRHRDAYYPDDFGQSIYNKLGGYYKYMWYGYFRGEDGYDFAGEGDHGQFIYISPFKNLIIIRNGMEYGGDWNSVPWIKAFYQFSSEY